MRFSISRTSGSEPPCSDAYKLPDQPEWSIDILDLAALMALQHQLDTRMIISGDTLEIYDDYRE